MDLNTLGKEVPLQWAKPTMASLHGVAQQNQSLQTATTTTALTSPAGLFVSARGIDFLKHGKNLSILGGGASYRGHTLNQLSSPIRLGCCTSWTPAEEETTEGAQDFPRRFANNRHGTSWAPTTHPPEPETFKSMLWARQLPVPGALQIDALALFPRTKHRAPATSSPRMPNSSMRCRGHEPGELI